MTFRKCIPTVGGQKYSSLAAFRHQFSHCFEIFKTSVAFSRKISFSRYITTTRKKHFLLRTSVHYVYILKRIRLLGNFGTPVKIPDLFTKNGYYGDNQKRIFNFTS